MSHFDILCPECKKRMGGCHCFGQPREQRLGDHPCPDCSETEPAFVDIYPVAEHGGVDGSQHIKTVYFLKETSAKAYAAKYKGRIYESRRVLSPVKLAVL